MSWSLYYNGPAGGAMQGIVSQGVMGYPLASPAEDATRAAVVATALAAAASLPADAPFSVSATGYEYQDYNGAVVTRRQTVNVMIA